MTTTYLTPLLGGPPWAGGPGHFHPPVFAPLIGLAMLLLLLLLATAAFLLARRGRLGPPPWVAARMAMSENNPDLVARRILAERFAKGDISSDEFLERASVLNWNPGTPPFPPPPAGKKKNRR